jgi:hypothetical protein
MKNLKNLLLATVVVVAGLSTAVQAQQKQTTEPNFFEIQKKALEFYKNIKPDDKDDKELPEAGGYAQYKRWEWFWQQRVTADGKFPDPMVIYNETAKSKADQLRRLQKQGAAVLSATDANWKEIGPAGVPLGSGAGRINRVHINTDFPDNIWVGTAAGGAWLSTNKGQTWTPKTDGIPSLGVTDIATTNADPRVIYIATGDGYGTGAGVQTPMSYSVGVLRSADGGQTWQTTGLNWQTSNARVIRRLLLSPANPQLLLAATNQGIYRTTNSGVSWSLTQSGSNIWDMEYKPDDPTTLYACSGNVVYRSTNEGASWQALSTGIPNTTGRIALAVTSANPEMVYALCANGNTWMFGGLYTSTNGGQNWLLKASSPNIIGRALDGTDSDNQQGFYDLCIAVSPTNANIIYVGGINIWKSTNGGSAWAINAHWIGAGGKPYVHADVHDLVTTEDNAAAVFAGCDGGIFQTKNNGTSWSDLSAGMGIMQFYRFSTAVGDPYLIIGGAQDNGTNRLKNGTWTQVSGGDGMNCLIDPTNPSVMYSSIYNGKIDRSSDGGNTFSGFIYPQITNEGGAWVTPFILDPVTPSVVYAGYSNVWKFSANKWAKISNLNIGTIIHLAIAPSDNKYIYAGNSGALRRTTNGGTTLAWDVVSVPAGNISSITVHPTTPRRIWVTAASYTGKSVFESNDGGTTWADISDGLPAIPVNCLIYQKNSPDRMYVGTDAGVYYRDNTTNQWLPYSDGLPNVIVTGLDIHYGVSKLRAGTFGRGIWEGNLVNCNAPAVTVTVSGGKTTVCEGDSVRLTANAGFNTYKWSNGATTQSIVVKQSGDYSVVATDGTGCAGASTVTTITVSAKKIPAIKGDIADSSTCEGKPITLDVGFGFTSYKIKWNTGDTTRKITVTKPGAYSATATSDAGCVGVSTVFIVKAALAPNKPIITTNASKDTLSATAATKYQWKIDGVDAVGATGQKFAPPASANGKKVTVMVYNAGGCGTLSDPQVIGSIGVDEDIAEQALQIFPNPTVNMITLDLTLKTAKNITVEITNTAGASMQSLQFPSDNLSVHQNISLKELPAGAYIITVKAGEQKWIRKIVKE